MKKGRKRSREPTTSSKLNMEPENRLDIELAYILSLMRRRIRFFIMEDKHGIFCYSIGIC